jgi:hypothetical protein
MSFCAGLEKGSLALAYPLSHLSHAQVDGIGDRLEQKCPLDHTDIVESVIWANAV